MSVSRSATPKQADTASCARIPRAMLLVSTERLLCMGSPSHLVPCAPTASLPGWLRSLHPRQGPDLRVIQGKSSTSFSGCFLTTGSCPASCIGCALWPSVALCRIMLQRNDIEMGERQQNSPPSIHSKHKETPPCKCPKRAACWRTAATGGAGTSPCCQAWLLLP